MFIFTDQKQEDKYDKDFVNLIASFAIQPQKNKKKAINCTLQIFLNQQSETRLIKSQFFETENMNYSEYMNYTYLNHIYDFKLYEFTDYEISIFRPKL